MDPLTAIGLGLTAIQFASNLFGKSETELREEEIREATQQLEQARQKQLTEGVGNILRQTESGAASARSAATARALASGRTGSDVEAYTIPAEGQVRRYGSQALTKFQTDTNDSFNQQIARLRMGNIGGPRSPNAGDYAGAIGSGLLRYGLLRDRPATSPTTGVGGTSEVYTPPTSNLTDSGANTEDGVFQMEDAPARSLATESITRPETNYRSLQYRRPGLRRANIF